MNDASNSNNKKHDRYIVPGLVRGLKILQSFTGNTSQMGIADIACALDVSRSTAFRLAFTLEKKGFLQRVEHSKKFRLGLKVLDLGFKLLAEMDIVDVARPHLEDLTEQTKVSSHLAVRDGCEIVYVARVTGKNHIVSTVGVGTRFPAHATSSGRILLSDLSITEIAALYDGVTLQAATAATQTTIGDLINLLEQDRQNGYVLSWGAYEKNLASIAAPVRDTSGRATASINISCPTSTYTRKELQKEILPVVLGKAAIISSALGYRG